MLPLLFVRIPQPARLEGSEGRRKSSVLADMGEGLRFLRGWPGLMMMVGIATLINLLFTPAFSLQPRLVTRHFGGGAPELAWLQSALGIGMVLGGVTLGAWGGFKSRTLTGVLALALAGVAVTMVGLTPATALPLAIGAMFVTVCMLPIANGSMFAVMQAIVPPEVQGRVFSLVISGASVMSSIGLAAAGPVADAMGVQVWYLTAGIGIAAMGFGASLVPAIMRIEETARRTREAAEPEHAASAATR